MSALQLAALKERARARQAITSPTSTIPQFDPSAMCICNRKRQDILCRSCGFIFVGRVRKHCRLHPNEILLMDSSVCPKCRTDSLLEIQSSNAEVEKEPDAIMDELTHLRRQRRSSSSFSTGDMDWDSECSPVSMKPGKESLRMKIPTSTGGQISSSVSPESIKSLPKLLFRE